MTTAKKSDAELREDMRLSLEQLGRMGHLITEISAEGLRGLRSNASVEAVAGYVSEQVEGPLSALADLFSGE